MATFTTQFGTDFDVILTDPPWKYYGQPDKWAAAGKHYRCLDYDEILEIRPPLASPGILFMWTTSAFLESSMNLLREWNLHYRGVAFVWVKTRADGSPIGAQGVRPSITKPLTEFVIAGSSQRKGRPLPLSDESIPQTVFAHRREHSRKPDEVAMRIEAMYPAARKLEMFARCRRDGWSAFGNEVEKF